MSENLHIQCQITGLRHLMFDRYAGDNSTQLQVAEKMYLDGQQRLILPAINLFSLLCSENSKSVCKQFFGKTGRTIALGISSYVSIEPFEIPILDGKCAQIVFNGFGDKIISAKHVARLPKGIPNPKERPMIRLPWLLRFTVDYQENKYCTIENLRQAFMMGGTLGVGTFRPYFGRYELTQWDMEK